MLRTDAATVVAALALVTADARVRDLESDVRDALARLASPHADDRRWARVRLGHLIDEATAVNAHAAKLINRAMTAANAAATALRQDEKGEAA